MDDKEVDDRSPCLRSKMLWRMNRLGLRSPVSGSLARELHRGRKRRQTEAWERSTEKKSPKGRRENRVPGLVTSQEASNGFNEASSSLVAATALEMSGLVKKNNKTRILVVGGEENDETAKGISRRKERERKKEREEARKKKRITHTHTHTQKKKLIRRVVRAGRRHDQHSRGAIDSISGNATRRLQWHCRRRHPTLTEPSITTQ